MACKSEIRTIDGHDYNVTQMPPTQAVPYHIELATLLAEVVAPLARSQSMSADAVGEALALAAPALRANLTPARFLEIAKDWTSSVHRDGVPVNFELDFAGSDMPALYKLMLFILEANFSDFLDGLGLGAIASAVMAQASTSQPSAPTSTGTSGE